jgi:hypothetical protein
MLYKYKLKSGVIDLFPKIENSTEYIKAPGLVGLVLKIGHLDQRLRKQTSPSVFLVRMYKNNK